MITFDVLTLKAFYNEQCDFFSGARINKIQQPTRREFIFSLRNNGESRQLYVNIDPQFYHICFMSELNREKRQIVIPQKPPMFCMLLRKYMENSRIVKVSQPENERILEFYIETYNELGEKICLCLACEFMGKYSNVILYNCDTDIIIGSAHNVGEEKSRQREVYGGIPYVYPPKQTAKTDIKEYYGEIDYSKLSQDFYMISSALAKDFAKIGASLEKVKEFLSLKNLSPVISEDFEKYSLYKELCVETSIAYGCVNEMIDTYYAHYIEKNKFQSFKAKYKTLLQGQIKKSNKALKQMQYQLLSDSDCDKFRLYGDLLMANLYNLRDYSQQVSVYDYENDEQISISLDCLKSIKENANIFYKNYNKAKNARAKLTDLISETVIKTDYFEQVLYSVECSQNIDDLYDIESEITALFPDKINQQDKKQKNNKIEIDNIKYDSDTIIYIGKNNKQNDYIISKLCLDEDIWFHAHNMAGSHVLLKTKNVTDELIMQCARLAKEYSRGKNSSKVGVIYTKCKYLRKPPKAALGYVTYKNEQEIIID